MEKAIIKFDDIKVLKQKFHQHKRPISLINKDTDKIVVSNEVPFGKKGFKYFLGYKDAKNIKPLCVFQPKMTAYRKVFDETKYRSFLIKDNELLGKYNEIWDKVSHTMEKNLIVIQYTIKNI